jgi:peptidoglycan/LPS O-acetylase OafA/YrhL
VSTEARGVLLPITRAGIAVLLVLAVLNGVWLYCFPAHAVTGYAWKIKPAIAAAFLGGGYLAGAAATGLIVFRARRWRSAQPLGLSLAVLSVLLLAATAIHHAKFRFHYAPTWGWVIVYAVAPPAIAALMTYQRRLTDVPPADPTLKPLRVISLVAGVLLVAGAAALFASPVGLGKHWPWPLTPLLARATASWYAMVGTALLWSAAGLRERTEAFVPYTTLGAWCVALLALPALHPDDLVHKGAALVAYLVLMAALLVIALYGVARSERHPL